MSAAPVTAIRPDSAPSGEDGILVVKDVTKHFPHAGRRGDRGRQCLPQRQAGRVPRRDRPVRLRQVDVIQCGRRTARRLRGRGHGRRRTHHRPACFGRHGVPGGIHLSLAHGDRECLFPARDRGHAEGEAARQGAPFHQDGRSRRIRESLSERIVRRHAPARLAGAHAGIRAENSADGRAVRGARRADEASARRQGAADSAGVEADHAAHHPQHHRSGAAFGPHPGDDVPARQDQTCRQYRPAAAAHLRSGRQRCLRPLCRTDLVGPPRRGEPRHERRRSRAHAPPGHAANDARGFHAHAFCAGAGRLRHIGRRHRR